MQRLEVVTALPLPLPRTSHKGAIKAGGDQLMDPGFESLGRPHCHIPAMSAPFLFSSGSPPSPPLTV